MTYMYVPSQLDCLGNSVGRPLSSCEFNSFKIVNVQEPVCHTKFNSV